MIPEKPIQTFSFIKDFMRKKHHFLLLSSLFIIVLFTFPAYSTPSLDDTLILEDFEDGILDSRITISTVGSFNSSSGIKDVTSFGSAKAFGFGLSTCPSSCFDNYVTKFIITFPSPTVVNAISFKEMELYDNWGSIGEVYVDGTLLPNSTFGREPINDWQPDTNFREREFYINSTVSQIELRVRDITSQSEIVIDDLGIIEGGGRTSLDSGLVAYYPFNGNANDESGNGNDGIVNGAVFAIDRFENANSAYSFDGVDDYIDYGALPLLNFLSNSSFTICGWIKTTESVGMILSQRNSGDGGTVVDIALGYDGISENPGRLKVIVRQDGSGGSAIGVAVITGAVVNDGNWRHFALIRKTGGIIELFLDGMSQGTHQGSRSGGALTTNLRTLGTERLWWTIGNITADQTWFNGFVDDIRIYNRALTEAEVQTLYQIESTGLQIITTSVTSTPSQPGVNQQVDIGVQIVGVNPAVSLVYGKGADNLTNNTTSIPMNLSDNEYIATIPANDVTQEGLWYRIKAENGVDTVYYPSETGFRDIKIAISNFNSIQSSGAFPSGIPANNWNTVSLPFNAALTLSDIFGAQQLNNKNEPTNWAAYEFVNGNFQPVSSIMNGNSYFLYHTSGAGKQLSVSSALTNNLRTFERAVLKPGWNLLQWPYSFSTTLAVTDANKIGSVWQQVNGNWEQAQQIPNGVNPYSGLAIFNKTNADIAVGSVLTRSSSTALPKRIVQTDWHIRFKVSAGECEDIFNFVGISGQATEGRDFLDEAEPLNIGKHLSLYFLSKNEHQGKLSRDIRSNKTAGNTWEMVVHNSRGSSEILLNWEKQDFPADLQAVLVDITNNKVMALTGSDSVTKYHFQSREETRFKVIVGNDGYVRGTLDAVKATLPQQFSLSQNYPNPFNPSTKIDFELPFSSVVKLTVYNILGEQVKTLVKGFYETGKYTIRWNGTDHAGNAITAGIYLLRLEAGRYSRVVKALLVK
ncbi:MAG: T9SS type A sorting domain-containing protein [Calditrichaeota bacterium]|nr:T9SS type A sorting domain-containing protein [Calditrichota bacterium]